jgi:hypothetical protein
MKHIYIITLLLALSTSAVAQHMLIDRGGDNNLVIELNDLKRITFDGDIVNVEQTDGTSNSAAMGEINRIYFGDFTRIEDVKPQNRELISLVTSESIAINCEAGTIITIYDVIGSQVMNIRLRSEGEIIGIAQLPKGIYIIKANDRTAKFLKR